MKSAVARFVDGRLFSPHFNDYYAARDPVAEALYVHVQPAELKERMRACKTFTIFEFGFGAGINFLTIIADFLKYANSGARLRFISCEVFPLELNTLRQVYENVCVDRSLSCQLMDFYPPLISGIYRQLFCNDKVELTLMFTDVEIALREFIDQDSVGVDSWILDGFAPDRNPQMWKPELLAHLAECTRPSGTVTTFSSASTVRRSLEQNGFSVRKIEGTPFKRQTTIATLNQPKLQPMKPPTNLTVVGGGFAGTATARALARRGVQIQLLTPTGKVGDATSGIPTAVVHPRLSTSMEVPAYFRTQTYFFSAGLLQRCLEHVNQGAVQTSGKNMSASRLKDITDLLGENWAKWLVSAEFHELTNLEYRDGSAFFPKSLVVNGEEMCRTFADHSHIEVVAKQIANPFSDELMIYATGSASVLGKLSDSWELLTIEGQIDTFGHASKSAIPRQAIVQDGYIVPTHTSCVAGSTYEYTKWELGLATAKNLGRLQQATKRKNWTHTGMFRGKRTVTSDKLPVVGQIEPNIWVNLAHGSSGTTSTPFCAEMLASQISGELAPLWQECFDQLHPSRFKERQVRRPNPLQRHQQ